MTENLQVARCSMNPHDLGLDGFNTGDEYLFLDEGVGVVTVYLPRLDYLDRLNTPEIREAGTIRLGDFRAFFCITDKRASDYQ